MFGTVLCLTTSSGGGHIIKDYQFGSFIYSPNKSSIKLCLAVEIILKFWLTQKKPLKVHVEYNLECGFWNEDQYTISNRGIC